ncbi:SDR family oxidoreductase [Mycolicibacterium sp. 3033]|nr:SDR family oxidoreductase [Mycolicibacterium aurantiacum]
MSNIAVVTGGAGGMGLATARVLGREMPVLISDVVPDRLEVAQRELHEAGVECATAICDVTDRAAVASLVRQARELGTVTSVVHAAGVSPGMGSADLMVKINAVGTVLINEGFLQCAQPGVALVNVASVAGHQLPGLFAPVRRYRRATTDLDRLYADLLQWSNRFPRSRRSQMAYMLSKHFVIWYSRVMAAPFGAKGARVLSVSPGSFDTGMGRLEDSRGAGALARLGALERFGRPSEIGELLAFCASAKPGYLTGTDIVCDGGVMARMRLTDMIKLARAK